MNSLLKVSVILGVFSHSVMAANPAPVTGNDSKSIYDFKVKGNGGEDVSLGKYKGKVLLVVNTASKCGYTPQYKGLEEIYQRYHAQGFEILAFPSNDFGSQEPGTAPEIKKFCETRYHVTFPLFEKNPVSGSQKQPLYHWLVENDSSNKNSEVKWNFEKFLVSRDGKILQRFRSAVRPTDAELTQPIEKALK